MNTGYDPETRLLWRAVHAERDARRWKEIAWGLGGAWWITATIWFMTS